MYALILLCLSILYFYPLLSSSDIFIERDLSVFFIPPRYLWVHLAKAFELPLWNPHNYSGIPLLATLQPGILYPPQLLYLFLPFNIVWNWLIILHFFFSGLTVFVFLRYLKCSKEASFAGAVTFMLSGYLLSVHNLLPHLFSVSWFPLVLTYFLTFCETENRKHLVAASVCLCMQFLAGAPEIVIMTVLILLVLAFFTKGFTGKKKGWFFLGKAVVLTILLFLLLSSVQLIPFYELKSQSIRRVGLSYQEATVWSFAWRDFIQFFIPDFYGYFLNSAKYWSNQAWLKTVYLGMIPFLLSTFYFVSKDKRRWIFLLLMLLSLILSLGGNTPLYQILYRISPFNSIRYPVKFLFVFCFIISVTCALGLDRLKKGVDEGDRDVRFVIKMIFYLGFIFALLWGYVTVFEGKVYQYFDELGVRPDAYNDINFNIHNIKRFLLFSFFFCISLLLYMRMRFKKTILYVIAFLLVSDLFLANYGFYQRIPWAFYTDKPNYFEVYSKNRATERYLVAPKTQKKFDNFPYDKEIVDSPFASVYGFYAVGGAEVLRIGEYDSFLGLLNNTASITEAKRFFDIAGIRYVVVLYEVSDKEFKLLRTDTVKAEKVYLYEYLSSPGRFLLYGRAHHVKDEKTMTEMLLNEKINLRKELIILSSRVDEEVSKNVKGIVKLVSYKTNRIVLECESDKDAYLYVTDAYYPGWRANVDGKETKIYKANLAFRAIGVPRGKHTVVFTYVPLSFYGGLFLTLIGILLSIYLTKKKRA